MARAPHVPAQARWEASQESASRSARGRERETAIGARRLRRGMSTASRSSRQRPHIPWLGAARPVEREAAEEAGEGLHQAQIVSMGLLRWISAPRAPGTPRGTEVLAGQARGAGSWHRPCPAVGPPGGARHPPLDPPFVPGGPELEPRSCRPGTGQAKGSPPAAPELALRRCKVSEKIKKSPQRADGRGPAGADMAARTGRDWPGGGARR